MIRGLHGLLGCLILTGLLAVGLAFTFAIDEPGPRVEHWHTCTVPAEQC